MTRPILEVRNPLTSLPAAARIRELPLELRMPLADLLREIAADADVKAEDSWRRRKGPMAAYWRATSTYAKHTARAVVMPDERRRARPRNLIADRLTLEGRGPMTGDEANRATVACDRCPHCLELGCNGHEVESDAELDAIVENLKTARRDGLPTDALEARYRVLTSGTVTVERRS